MPRNLEEAFRSSNCSITAIQPQDMLYGVDRSGPNDTSPRWVGMVGQLDRREADLCAAVLTYTRERAEVIDYTVGVMLDRVSLIVADPAKLGGQDGRVNMTVFVEIFTAEAWAIVMLCVVMAAFSFSAVHFYGKRGQIESARKGSTECRRCHRNNINKTSTQESKTSSNIKSVLLGLNASLLILVQRPFLSDFEQSLNRPCFKVLFLTSSAMAIALFALYCGDLTAGMTIGGSPALLTSFEV